MVGLMVRKIVIFDWQTNQVPVLWWKFRFFRLIRESMKTRNLITRCEGRKVEAKCREIKSIVYSNNSRHELD